VSDFALKMQQLRAVLDQPYRGGNLLLNDDREITALLDFGLLTMYGDYLFDIATGWVFFDMYDELKAHIRERYLVMLLDQLGEHVRGKLYRYVLIYSIISANTYSSMCSDGHYQAPKLQRRLSFGQAIIELCWFFAVSFASFAFARTLLAIALLLLVENLVSPTYDTVRYSYRLALIPDGLQGRVNSGLAYNWEAWRTDARAYVIDNSGLSVEQVVALVEEELLRRSISVLFIEHTPPTSTDAS
jgi:hypothetical protein